MGKEQKLQQVGELFKNKINRVFLAGMAVLLLLRLLIYASESQYSNAPPAPPPSVDLKPTLSQNSPEFKKVQEMLVPWPEFSASTKTLELTRQNMFDPNRVLQAADFERQAEEKVTKAYTEFNKGNYEAARRLAQEGLSILGNHKGAKELLKKIDAKLGAGTPGEESTRPTTATATPAPR
ncbi:MAG: hypothetical protein M1457_14130 [bacterium]|nr:hypothetical protein [bacterium]